MRSVKNLLFVVWLKLTFAFARGLDIKTWSSNTNFGNPLNWHNGRLPCKNDRIIFEANNPVAVFMPQSASVAELVLPLNGELIFPQNAVLNITGGTGTASCPGQDVFFEAKNFFWHDPANWNITSKQAFPRAPARKNAAVPHALRVPCPRDKVIFPPDASFRVHIIRRDVQLSYLQINNREYSEDELKRLTRTPTGRLLFPEDPQIGIQPSVCSDPSGCVCGNELPEVFYTVCTFAVPCPELMCADPISVIGHCCPVCATKITAKQDGRFNMDKMLQFFQKYYNQREFFEVDSYISKTIDSTIQSVFVDGTTGNRKANKLADIVHSTMLYDHSYGLDNVEITKSEKWKEDGDLQYDSPSSKGLSSGGLAAIILLIILLCLAGAYYIYKKRRIPGFSFARFDLGSDKIELQLGTTPHDELEPDEPGTSAEDEQKRAFDNPIYDTVAEASVTEDSDDQGKDFVENPMFMIFEESGIKDDA